MARKKGASAHTEMIAPAAAAAAAPAMPIIKVAPGDLLEVLVDVGPMTIPYTVAFDGQTLIKSLVDRKDTVPPVPGGRLLFWAFAHTQKGWSHSIGYTINGGPLKVLESKSEARKDPDHSIGSALVQR